MLRELTYVQNVELRVMGKRDLSAMAGIAFHAGAAYFHRYLMDGNGYADRVVKDSVETALTALNLDMKDALERGRVVNALDTVMAANLEPKVAKAVDKYIASKPIPEGWTITHVELELPDSGGS